MTPRRSSGGPQCAFEENKKEREREPSGGASEGAAPSRERAAGRCRLAGRRRDRGATGRHFWRRGEGERPLQPRRPGRPSACGVGCDLCLGGLHFLTKDSQQLFGIFFFFFSSFHSCVDTRAREKLF